MPEKNISPEKRLLKMIEGQPPAAGGLKPGHLGRKYLSLSSIRGRLAFLRDRFKKRKTVIRPAEAADLRHVNTALQAGIAVVLLWLVIGSSLEYRRLRQGVVGWELPAVSLRAEAATVETPSLLQPVQIYMNRVAVRDVFTLAEVQPERTAAAFREQAESERVRNAVRHLKLVGISWSGSPDAIIEDTSVQRSYFVKEGALIEDIRVFKILKDRVILKYLGEEVDLR